MNTREDPNHNIIKWKYNWNNHFNQYRKDIWEIEIYGSVNKLHTVSLPGIAMRSTQTDKINYLDAGDNSTMQSVRQCPSRV